MNLYVDGVLTGSENESFGAIDDGGMSMRIGLASQDVHPFSGLIDEIRIYNYALSESEIQALYRETGQ